MRWRIPGCGVVVCAAALVAASIVAWGAMVVPWQAAGSYDGETITVEGDVVRARLEADTCVLEFSPDDPNAFRAILLIPLITDLPRQPQRLYENKRVQVSGTIRTWHGRPEMIVRSPGAIRRSMGVRHRRVGSARLPLERQADWRVPRVALIGAKSEGEVIPLIHSV